MNYTVIIIEAIVLTLAFTAMILIPLVKTPFGGSPTIPRTSKRNTSRPMSGFRRSFSLRPCC